MPEVRRGRPLIVAGASAAKNRVRWVHVSELLDIAHLLRGGELLLTTGFTFPEDPSELTAYVRELAAADLSGLVVELGRRYGELPAVMVRMLNRKTSR